MRAKPCEVTQRAMRTPMAPIFSLADPGAGHARDAAGRDAVVGAGADHHLLEVAHVAVHVAAVGRQLEDRIADHLAGAVVGDVAAAAGLEHLEAAARAARSSGKSTFSLARVAAEREDGIVLEQQQGVRDRARLALRHQPRLQLAGPRRRARGRAAGPRSAGA